MKTPLLTSRRRTGVFVVNKKNQNIFNGRLRNLGTENIDLLKTEELKFNLGVSDPLFALRLIITMHVCDWVLFSKAI